MTKKLGNCCLLSAFSGLRGISKTQNIAAPVTAQRGARVIRHAWEMRRVGSRSTTLRLRLAKPARNSESHPVSLNTQPKDTTTNKLSVLAHWVQGMSET